MFTDPYQTLGISPNATLAEAKAAYLKRVRVLHPDRFDPTSQKGEWELANQMLQELNEAWAIVEAKGTSTSDQKTTPSVPRPQPTGYAKPPATVPPRPKKEASQGFDQPITSSRVTGEPGPYSGQAIISVVLILLGLLSFHSIVSFLAFILAIVLAHTAKNSIRANQYQGQWMANLSSWAGYLGLIGLVASAVFASPPPPPVSAPSRALAESKQQIEQLKNELTELGNEQKQETEVSGDNVDAMLALLKLQVAASQSKIAEQTKALAELKQKYILLKSAKNGLDGSRAVAASTTGQTGSGLQKEGEANGRSFQELQKEMSDTDAQIAKIESELKSDKSSLNEQLAQLAKPRAEQIRQIDSQIAAQFEERRRLIKEKLSQLGEMTSRSR